MSLLRLAIVSGLLAGSSLLHAQKAPKRPKLPAGADTNSAQAYYDFAVVNILKDSEAAADALYWTNRLDPLFADGFYARRVALLLSDRRRLIRYWGGDRKTLQSEQIRRTDSLYYQALTLNPFVSQMLDVKLLDGIIDEVSKQYERENPSEHILASEMSFYLERSMNSSPPATRAWMAYGRGNYRSALELYAMAINGDKRNRVLHLDRARVFFQIGNSDSALVELKLGLEELRNRDKNELTYIYQSKALTEHSIGIVYRRLGQDSAAREAFGRAIQEDMAYAPAHMELAYLSIAHADTAAGLVELDLAAQVRADDPKVRYVNGFMLYSNNKLAEAEVQLRKAIELEPLFALPHMALGLTFEKVNKSADAAKEYNTFLQLSAKNDFRREEVTRRLAALGSP